MSGLSDLLQHLNTEGWSSRRIERETEAHGHKISFATASRYLAGTHPRNPDGKTLQVLADIFGADVNDLRAALGKPAAGEPFDLGPEASLLSGPQRDAVRHVVRVMLSESAPASARPPHDHVDDDAVPDGATTTQDDWDLAADEGHRSLDEDDARASRLGEESQDPGDWR